MHIFTFDRHSLLNDAQQGFLPKRSPVQSVFFHSSETLSRCGFVDLSKAFNMLNNRLLLAKLKALSIAPSFLTGQPTNESTSYRRIFILVSVTIWAPRVLALGPLLVLIFINDLFIYDLKVHIGCGRIEVYFSSDGLNALAENLRKMWLRTVTQDMSLHGNNCFDLNLGSGLSGSW